jgi:hypothetical protein
MATKAIEDTGWPAASTSSRWRPTSAVSGGRDRPCGDGRVPDLDNGGSGGRTVRGAVLSDDGHYRYSLTRAWGSGPNVVFVGLNPSTADDSIDDQSTRRMIGFARAAGCGSLTLVNLCGWRSTSPTVLSRVADPIGPRNDDSIADAVAAANLVIAAWGTHGTPDRVADVEELLAHHTVWCFGLTQDGHPRHPLYVPARTPLELFRYSSHHWDEWSSIPDVGLAEPLRERHCPTCGADEVDTDQQHVGRWS